MATRWGICGAGAISHDFNVALKCLPSSEHEVVCIAARDAGRAAEFAKRFDIPKSYGSYEELSEDNNIDIVYVGVIHVAHFDVCQLMINAGKNVLCEKPMTLSKKKTQELIDLAKEKNVFLMEAVWSRFLPSYKLVRDEIRAGNIGQPTYVSAEFGADLTKMNMERFMEKRMGAGSLVDLAPYTVGIALWAFDGEYPEEIIATGHLTEGGFDRNCGVVLKFKSGGLAVLYTSIDTNSANNAYIYGTKGKIEIKCPMWTPKDVVVNGKEHSFPPPESSIKTNFIHSTNLSYEAKCVRECLLKGEKECARVSHEHTLKMAAIFDEILRQLKVDYD